MCGQSLFWIKSEFYFTVKRSAVLRTKLTNLIVTFWDKSAGAIRMIRTVLTFRSSVISSITMGLVQVNWNFFFTKYFKTAFIMFWVADKIDIEQCSQKERSIFVERMKVWLDEVLHVLVDNFVEAFCCCWLKFFIWKCKNFLQTLGWTSRSRFQVFLSG